MQPTSSQVERNAGVEGTILGASGEFSWVDVGMEGMGLIPTGELGAMGPNDQVRVFVRGTDPDALCLVSLSPEAPPVDWAYLRNTLQRKGPIIGTVARFIRGGLRVALGAPVEAFLPASRSGTINDTEMESLIGRTIVCTIVEVDEADLNIVVDRRGILDAADAWSQSRAIEKLQSGSRVRGIVSTLTDFGAFVDIGGLDGLLHVKDISWRHIDRPSDVLQVGQEVEVLIERVEPGRGRVGLSMKALEPNPWTGIEQRFRAGDRVIGKTTTITDFGAFVELEPGVEGLVHQSDLSWSKKLVKPSELLVPGESREFVILSVDPSQRRIALSRKLAVKDPWADLDSRFPLGSVVTGTISGLTDFGAFVRLTEDIEGMIHVADVSERRLDYPCDVLKLGQIVRACVLEVDGSRRRLRLGLKQVQDAVAPIEPVGDVVVPYSPGRVGMVANYSAYSTTIFVNCPSGPVHRLVTDAIVFAVLDAGFLPRVQLDPESVAELFSAVRESQFGIHDLSQPFEAGVFMGSKEFGSDLHRAKEVLFLSANEMAPQAKIEIHPHHNDPAEAIRHVGVWLAEITNQPLVWQEVLIRYRQFREYMSDRAVPPGSEKLAMAERIAVAREWISSRRAPRPGASRG